MNLNVPIELHNSFKGTTAMQNQDMTTVLKFIKEYFSKHPSPKPRRRRA